MTSLGIVPHFHLDLPPSVLFLKQSWVNEGTFFGFRYGKATYPKRQPTAVCKVAISSSTESVGTKPPHFTLSETMVLSRAVTVCTHRFALKTMLISRATMYTQHRERISLHQRP